MLRLPLGPSRTKRLPGNGCTTRFFGESDLLACTPVTSSLLTFTTRSIRLNKNPRFYRSAASSSDGDAVMDAILDASPSERLQQLVSTALQGLEREGIIEEYGGKYMATNLGMSLAGSAVRFPTFIKLKESKKNASLQDVVSGIESRFCTVGLSACPSTPDSSDSSRKPRSLRTSASAPARSSCMPATSTRWTTFAFR